MQFTTLTLFTLLSGALAKNKFQPAQTTISPNLAEIAAAQATATSNQFTAPIVPGCVFDKYYQIWLENTDYEKAFEQEDMAWLRAQGITLTNYWALTHPSEPNYVAAVGGDYFGINNDDFFRVPENVSTVADLLDTKAISWAEYQEHQPYTGFQGMNFSRQSDLAPDYVRKHNPLVHYDSVVNVPERLGNLKNFTEFQKDVDNSKLPQWAFITPNMTNDAHDTDIEFAGKWTRGFLEPLLANKEFMENNLIIVTFDEVETYPLQNKVLAVLLGGAVPKELQGTSDGTYYSHYSNLATVQANWGLPHLGRGDVNANPFKFVADKLNIKTVEFDTTGQYNNKSVVGYFNDEHYPIPPPNVSAVGVVGNTILKKIADLWGGEVPVVQTPGCEKPTSSAAANVTAAATSAANATIATSAASIPALVSNSTVARTTTIEGAYVTVYTTDCPVTTVGPNGDISTLTVQSTVTETVCPKCSKKTETPAKSTPVAESKPAPSESKPVSPASKPAPSAETKPAPSPKPASDSTLTINQTITKTQGSATTAVPAKSTPAQSPKSSAPVQANGAVKGAVGAAAVVPVLMALF